MELNPRPLKPPAQGASLRLMAEDPRRRLRSWGTLVSLILLLVIALGLLAARHQDRLRSAVQPPAPPNLQAPAVDFDRFSAHRERSPDGERLSVSLRLRANQAAFPCFLFIVARNDTADPKVWALWPAEAAGSAMTSGGYFHGTRPSVGHALSLDASWQRVAATIEHPEGSPAFDTVVVYLLTPEGKVLLARPFKI